MVAIHGWAERDKLIHTSGPLGHIVRQPFEVVQDIVDACGQGYPFAFDVAKGLLHLPKYSPGSGEY